MFVSCNLLQILGTFPLECSLISLTYRSLQLDHIRHLSPSHFFKYQINIEPQHQPHTPKAIETSLSFANHHAGRQQTAAAIAEQ